MSIIVAHEGINRIPKSWYGASGGVSRKLKSIYGAAGGTNRKLFNSAVTWTIKTDNSNVIALSGEFLVDYSNSEGPNDIRIRINFDEDIYIDRIDRTAGSRYSFKIIPTGKCTTDVAGTTFEIIYNDGSSKSYDNNVEIAPDNKPISSIIIAFYDLSAAADQEIIEVYRYARLYVYSRDYGNFYINKSGTSDQ